MMHPGVILFGVLEPIKHRFSSVRVPGDVNLLIFPNAFGVHERLDGVAAPEFLIGDGDGILPRRGVLAIDCGGDRLQSILRFDLVCFFKPGVEAVCRTRLAGKARIRWHIWHWRAKPVAAVLKFVGSAVGPGRQRLVNDHLSRAHRGTSLQQWIDNYFANPGNLLFANRRGEDIALKLRGLLLKHSHRGNGR